MGDASALLPDDDDLDGDGDTMESIPFDLNGEPRVRNFEVDMGAYEFQPPLCTGDLTDPYDMIDIDDLFVVINDWGCIDPPGPCVGDIVPPMGQFTLSPREHEGGR